MVNTELALYIKQHTASKIRLTENTRLVRDLHLDGEKGVLFIKGLGQKFNIDINNFDFDAYFPLIKPDSAVVYPHTDLTLGSLERAIAVGSLDDSVITADRLDQNMPLEITPRKSVIGIIIGIILAILFCYIALNNI